MDMSLLIITLSIIGAIIILVNPFIGLTTVVVLMPQSLLPAISSTVLGVFTLLTPIKLAGGLTFGVSLIRHIFEHKNWGFLKKPVVLFSIFFTVWIYVLGFIRPGSFTRETFTIFTSFLMFGFIIISLVTNLWRFRVIVWIALISTFIVSLKAIVNYYNFSSTIRISGSAYGPNELAVGLIPLLSLGFYNIFGEKKIVFKLFSSVIAIVIASALILTFSRAGIIGLFIMLLVASLRARHKMRAIFLLVICIFIMWRFMPPYGWERLRTTIVRFNNLEEVSNVDSTKRRFLLALAAWKMFLDYPFIGVGPGNYYYKCREYEPVYAGRAHSMYLEIMAEEGVIGIFLFLAILVSAWKLFRRLAKREEPFRSYASGLYVGFTGFLIASIFLHAQQEKAFWFILFLGVALEQIRTSGLSTYERRPFKNKLAISKRVK